MPGTLLKPQKRVLGESTTANRNAVVFSPTSAKKRKLESDLPNGKFSSPQNKMKTKLGSSQPKSQFESEVLEKLTQDINGLKDNNAERDQQWDRPPLGDFNAKRDSLCFQQIEAEEGTLHGGRVTVKLFGVTEVCHASPSSTAHLTFRALDRSFCPSPCHRLPTLSIRRCSSILQPCRL